MKKPTLVERFADNGEHSHWDLVDENGYTLWSEDTSLFCIVDGLARQNYIHRTIIEKVQLITKAIPRYLDLISKVYSPAATHAINSGYVFPEEDMEEMIKESENLSQLCSEINK